MRKRRKRRAGFRMCLAISLAFFFSSFSLFSPLKHFLLPNTVLFPRTIANNKIKKTFLLSSLLTKLSIFHFFLVVFFFLFPKLNEKTLILGPFRENIFNFKRGLITTESFMSKEISDKLSQL